MSAKLTGGKVNYYLAKIEHPQREEQAPYQAECEDIIHALGMNFNEGCEFKAIWRTAAARKSEGKPGHSAKYDAEKRVHYANRDLKHYQQEEAKVSVDKPKNLEDLMRGTVIAPQRPLTLADIPRNSSHTVEVSMPNLDPKQESTLIKIPDFIVPGTVMRVNSGYGDHHYSGKDKNGKLYCSRFGGEWLPMNEKSGAVGHGYEG